MQGLRARVMSTVSATVSGQTVKYVQVWPENGPRQGGAVRSRAEQCGVGVTVWWCERKGTGVKRVGSVKLANGQRFIGPRKLG